MIVLLKTMDEIFGMGRAFEQKIFIQLSFIFYLFGFLYSNRIGQWRFRQISYEQSSSVRKKIKEYKCV